MFLDLLSETFENHSNSIAIEFGERSYHYCELLAQAQAVAGLLSKQGFGPGDRIILYLSAKEPFLLAYLGAVFAGCVPVPINPNFPESECRYYATDSQACAIVHDDSTSKAATALSGLVRSLEPLSHLQIFAAPKSKYRPPEIAPDSPALMLYSSGTTGQPKGVVHTQRNLAAAVTALRDVWRFTAADTLVNVLPLFHIHGLSFASNVSLLTGSRMVIGDSFHPVRTLELMDWATVFMGVPPYYYSFLKREEFRRAVSGWKLRLITCGSAPIRPEVLPRLESLLELPIINRYGMTECHVLTTLPIDGPHPHGSVGQTLPGIQIQLRSDRGGSCAKGEVGEVLARGHNLFDHYWQRADQTAECFHEGWFKTGDLGQLDQNGFLTLVGRNKDLIIVGGFNVYPPLVEQTLNAIGSIKESAVVGIPDARRGEQVLAAVVVESGCTKEQIKQHCRRHLADYQCPTRIEFMDELPRNSLGKVLKRSIRERFCD